MPAAARLCPPRSHVRATLPPGAPQIEWDSLEGTNASVPVRGEEWGAFFDGTDSLEGADDIRSVPVKPLQARAGCKMAAALGAGRG